MKTEEILLLDCRKEESKKTLNNFLWRIGPCERISRNRGCERAEIIPVETLEQVLHGFCEHYPYKVQQIWEYSENKKFQFYHMGVMRVTDTHEWLGDVNGITLWELLAKAIIKIYADIKRRK